MYEHFFEEASDLMGITELMPDGDILAIKLNKACRRYYGIDHPRSGTPLTALKIDAQKIGMWRSHYTASLNEKKPINFEHEAKHNGGSYVFNATVNNVGLSENGNPIFFFISRDITEKNLHEQRVRDNEERLKYALQGSKEALWDWNIISDKVFFSPRWLEMLGFSESEVSFDMNFWRQLVHRDDKKKAQEKIESHFSGIDEYFENEHRVKTRQGNFIWVLSRGKIVSRDAAGKPARMVGTYSDITKQRETQEILSLHRAKMASAAKMVALGEMAGGIAHEINTPLTVIKLSSASIRRYLSSDQIDRATARSALERVDRTVDQISSIVRGLKSFIRNDSTAVLGRVPLSEILESTFVFCRDNIAHLDIALRVENRAPAAVIMCVPSQISQVILNLLNNAIDAVRDQVNPAISVEVMNTIDRSVVIKVCDNGSGIEPAIRDKVMTPFFTTKPLGKGTGLGLSLSKEIAEFHGGSLVLGSSSYNTEVIFSLPVSC